MSVVRSYNHKSVNQGVPTFCDFRYDMMRCMYRRYEVRKKERGAKNVKMTIANGTGAI